MCEVTGRRKHGKGLEVPCVYKFFGSEKIITKLKDVLYEKSPSTTSNSQFVTFAYTECFMIMYILILNVLLK